MGHARASRPGSRRVERAPPAMLPRGSGPRRRRPGRHHRRPFRARPRRGDPFTPAAVRRLPRCARQGRQIPGRPVRQCVLQRAPGLCVSGRDGQGVRRPDRGRGRRPGRGTTCPLLRARRDGARSSALLDDALPQAGVPGSRPGLSGLGAAAGLRRVATFPGDPPRSLRRRPAVHPRAAPARRTPPGTRRTRHPEPGRRRSPFGRCDHAPRPTPSRQGTGAGRGCPRRTRRSLPRTDRDACPRAGLEPVQPIPFLRRTIRCRILRPSCSSRT